MLKYTLDLCSPVKPLDKYWNFCVGSCHASTALRDDWRKMLFQCHTDIGFKYIRFHGLFNDDMSVVQKPMFSDKLILSFSNIDNLFDFLLSIGMKPFVELSFMPQALASADTTIFNYKGNTSPPACYDTWSWFIGEFISHIAGRYGLDEIRTWFFEVWNEPNLGGVGSPFGFWSGDREEYFKLYKTTAQAIKAFDKRLQVGGPATSNNAWISEFLDFCENHDAPVDFISTHHYPTDVVLGYGVEDSANLVNPLDLSNQSNVEKVIKLSKEGGEKFEEFKKQYSVFKSKLWENVDRGVLTQMTKRAVSEARGLPVYYTEWGSLAGLESDGAFGSSFIVKTILDGVDLVQGYSFWTFCDIVEENGQNSDEFFGGFGLMTQHGIPKAPYRVYQLLNKLDGRLYLDIFREGTVDIYAVDNDKIKALQLIAVNHHSLLHSIDRESIQIKLKNASPVLKAEIIRVDDEHANACRYWLDDGGSAYLSQGKIDILKGLSEFERESLEFTVEQDCITLNLELAPMGTAFITVYQK